MMHHGSGCVDMASPVDMPVLKKALDDGDVVVLGISLGCARLM